MSAKKRGPGRPPKSKNRKPAATAVHTVPKHFWGQIGAIILAVLTVMLVAGLFGMGGEFPVKFAKAVRWLVGWTAFVIPVIFAVQIVQVFKQPDERIPAVIWVSTVLFLALFAGTFQLALSDPTSLVAAQSGVGGGTVGWAVADLALGFVNVPVAALIFVALMLILLLFIFSISPAAVIDAIKNFVGREDADEPKASAVAPAKAGKMKVGGMGEGEIEKEAPEEEEKPKKAKRGLLSKRKKDAEEDDSEPAEEDKKAKTKPALHDLEIKKSANLEKADEPVAPVINNSNWEFPPISILSKKHKEADPGNMKLRAQQIESTLMEFGVGGNVKKANIGPRVTQYCLEPQRGVPMNKFTSLQDEFIKNLQVESLRIEAPIPGQPYVGLEVPNKSPASVSLRSILETKAWVNSRGMLTFAVGLNVTGEPIVMDLAELPHLLIAGTTNSGKSVMMNVMVMSMLFRNTPDDLKFVLVDPKGNEMSAYDDMPHLAAPVIGGTSSEAIGKLTRTLQWVCDEMDRRFDVFAKRNVRKISVFKDKYPDEKMPNIVVIIDEYTDILDSAKSTEREIIRTCTQRIAQKGRAAGIHEVIMMQAPRAAYLQGPLKANIPAGFAFAVLNKRESIQIIGQAGAEKLMGKGDMLMVTLNHKKPRRVQAAFVDDDEVEQVVTRLKMQSGPQYDDTLLARLSDEGPANGGIAVPGAGGGSSDPMYQRAVQTVIEQNRCSTSFLQRRLGIGFSRASRIVDEMEENGVVGPSNGSKPREVLISSIDDISE